MVDGFMLWILQIYFCIVINYLLLDNEIVIMILDIIVYYILFYSGIVQL